MGVLLDIHDKALIPLLVLLPVRTLLSLFVYDLIALNIQKAPYNINNLCSLRITKRLITIIENPGLWAIQVHA